MKRASLSGRAPDWGDGAEPADNPRDAWETQQAIAQAEAAARAQAARRSSSNANEREEERT